MRGSHDIKCSILYKYVHFFLGKGPVAFIRVSKTGERRVWSKATPSHFDSHGSFHSPRQLSHPGPGPLSAQHLKCRPDPPLPCLKPTETVSYHTWGRTQILHGTYKAQRDLTPAAHTLPISTTLQPFRPRSPASLLPRASALATASPGVRPLPSLTCVSPSGRTPFLPDLSLNVTSS